MPSLTPPLAPCPGAAATPLAMRWLHLLALAVLLGGAVQLALATEVPLAAARRYEYAFWAAFGVLVLTGVGNVGALAPAVPGPTTAWGRLLTLKLAAVLLLVAFSLVRSGVVARRETNRAVGRGWYAATTGWVAVLGGAGVVLAHG